MQLSASDLMGRWGVSRKKFYAMKQAGDIPDPVRLPGRDKWAEVDVIEWEKRMGWTTVVAEQERILAFHKVSEAKITEFCKYLDKIQTYKRVSEDVKGMGKATATMLRNPLIPLVDRCRVYDITLQWFEVLNSNPDFDKKLAPRVTKMISDGSIFKWLEGVEDAK